MKRKIFPFILVATFLLASPLLFAQEIPAEEPKAEELAAAEEALVRTDIEIIQLRDPFEPLDEKVQKYFNIDTTYDYDEETTTVWTTLGFGKEAIFIFYMLKYGPRPKEREAFPQRGKGKNFGGC